MTRKLIDKRWPWLLAAFLIALGLVASMVRRQGGDPRPPGTVEDIEALARRKDVNVLFILVDMLRADRLGAYGYARDTSPVIDHLAKSGVRFAKHLSQSSWTKCSMASLWTSLNPNRNGVTRFDHGLPQEARMPAEILKEAGFRTVGLYRNGWVAPTFGFEQGFDVYERPIGSGIPASAIVKNPTLKEGSTDVDAVQAAEEFLRVRGRERWFLYLHLMDVHEYLYDEQTAVFGSRYSDIYDSAVLRVNHVIGLLMEHLAQQGYLDHTLIAIASDHGEAFLEHGFEGHARKVYRETQEVPLVLAFPFRLEPGIEVRTRTRNVDLWPTLLDLLGLPPMQPSDGRSRRPEILAAARGAPLPEPNEPSFSFLDQSWGNPSLEPAPTLAVTEGSYRFVVSDDKLGRQEHREELFDSNGDPLELRDRIGELPEVAARLRQTASAELSAGVAWTTANPKLQLDELQLGQLRALGYAVP